MKSIHTYILVIVLLLGCNSNNDSTTGITTTIEKPSEEVSASASYTTEKFVYINNAENTNLAEIKVNEKEISINTPELNLFGILKEDKRKYYDQKNMHLYSVKYKDDGFKLRDGTESLLWKIKMYDDKIKIANNEEMSDAFAIKLKEDNRIKVEQAEEEIFSLRIPSDASAPVKIGVEYLVSGLGYSTAAGVLKLEKLAPDERFVIIAELVNAQP